MKSPDKSISVYSSAASFTGMEKTLTVLTFFSGAAGLIYEILWMRSFGLIFGNTTHAITVILATYMGGIALGSYLVGRIRINKPLRTYAFAELLIALSAILAFFLLKMLPGAWGNFLRHTPLPGYGEVPLRIILSGLVILIPTLAMGATVPLMVQVLSRKVSHHKVLSRLYYLNTLGGASGVLAATYFLFPVLGLSMAYGLAVVLNLGIAGLCFLMMNSENVAEETNAKAVVPNTPGKIRFPVTFALAAFFVGACSFSLEILWSRSFALVIGSSIYSFNLMLFSFLLGMVVGTWLYERFWRKIRTPQRLLSWLLLLLGFMILLSGVIIGWLPLFYYSLMDFLPLSFGVYQLVGFLLCFLTMILLTAQFGFIFPLLLQLVNKDTHNPVEARLITSKLYAWNTLGTMIGALLTGFVLIPALGLQKGYVLAAGVMFLLGISILGIHMNWRRPVRVATVMGAITCIVLLTAFWKPWDPLVVTSGLYQYGMQQNKKTRSSGRDLLESYRKNRKVLYYKEGIEGVVAVIRSEAFGLFLSVNGKTDASQGDLVTQKMLAHVPLAVHPDPENALVIGWGSGCTSGTAGLYPLQSIQTIEIDPAVYKPNFLFSGINNKIYEDPRFSILFKDGRNVLLTTPYLYDVIISEPSNPWITGVSNLFTKEFYESGLARLDKQGVFCQWFHVYNMPLEVLQSQVQTFCSVFPGAMLWLIPPEHRRMDESSSSLNGDVLLLGSRDPIVIDMNRMRQVFDIASVNKDLYICGIKDPSSFISNAILDRKGLLSLCGDAPLNTDGNPFIEFNAPQGLFQDQASMRKQVALIYEAIQQADTAILPAIVNDGVMNSTGDPEAKSQMYDYYGEIYLNKNMFLRSERAYREAFRLVPDASRALSLAGMYIRWKKNDEALEWCDKASELMTNDLPLMDRLGMIYERMRKQDKAKAVFTRMMEDFPGEAQGSYRLGMLLYEEKNYIQAEILLRKALALNPGLSKAKLALKMINN